MRITLPALFLFLALSGFASQTNLALLTTFGHFDEANPSSELIEASDKRLYGFASKGGTNKYGAVFRVNKNGTGYQVLHSFSQKFPGLGQLVHDSGALIEAGDETLYGGSRRLGIFKLNKDGSGYQHLLNTSVYPPVVVNEDGWIFAVNSNGLFKIRTNGVDFTYLTNSWPGGLNTYQGIIKGSGGQFYGTIGYGSTGIYRVAMDGSGFEMLQSFPADPTYAEAREVIEGNDGWLYGTVASTGYRSNYDGFPAAGLIFKVQKNGSSFTILHKFTGYGGEYRWSTNSNVTDGGRPWGRLFQDTDGVIYGTTQYGGIYSGGTVFRINPDGSDYRIIQNLSGSPTNAAQPQSGVIVASDGKLYGTSTYGGNIDQGTIFTLNKDGTDYEVLRRFSLWGREGAGPLGAIIQARDGFLYGTTSRGGSNEFGTLYRLNRDGTGHTVIKSFAYNKQDGGVPLTGVIEGTDGILYGTTALGGSNMVGTVYRINKDGTGYKVLHHFVVGWPEANKPITRLLEASDGFLYGVARKSGSDTYFKLSKTGSSFQIIQQSIVPFETHVRGSELNEAPGGYLYGSSRDYYSEFTGRILRTDKSETSTETLAYFPATNGQSIANHPSLEGLMRGTNGSFYGAASGVFTFDPLTSAFLVWDSQFQGTRSISLDTDGTLYGIKTNDSSVQIYKAQQDGSGYLPLYSPGTNSQYTWPYSKLLISRDGTLFGTAAYTTNNRAGAIFKLFAGPFPTLTLANVDYSHPAITLTFSGTTGQTFRVQATENLQDPIWHPVGSATIGANGTAEVLDPQAGNYGTRFYRAAQP